MPKLIAANVAKEHADLLIDVERMKVIEVRQKRTYAINERTWKRVTREMRKLQDAGLVWLDDRFRYPLYKLTQAGELARAQHDRAEASRG